MAREARGTQNKDMSIRARDLLMPKRAKKSHIH